MKAVITRPTKVGRELASLRKKVKKTCVVCGIEIVALKQAKYCSNRCRQRAKYQRQKSETPGKKTACSVQ